MGFCLTANLIHVRFEQDLFLKMNISPSENLKKKFVGLGDYKVWELLKESFKFNESLDQLLMNDRKERLKFFIENEIVVMPGARELLERLKTNGFRLALASSSPMELIELNLSRSGFDQFFRGQGK